MADALSRSLAVIETAEKELPRTAALARSARSLPDGFSQACSAAWGFEGETYSMLLPDLGATTTEEYNHVTSHWTPLRPLGEALAHDNNLPMTRGRPSVHPLPRPFLLNNKIIPTLSHGTHKIGITSSPCWV